jgi:CubicO group peptidase (beta-lactamase class C family)
VQTAKEELMSYWPGRLWTLPVLLAALLFPAAGSAAAPDAAAIDKIVQEGLKTWQVPGAAVAIVQNDKVVFLKGYGVRELGGGQAVTARTRFGIASLTKAFTTTALAMLADEGKLAWDDPVRQHVPFFRLVDPLADENVTLRDLVCHRTGVGRHDLLWLRAPWGPEETVRRLAYVKPSHSFRSRYEYNNIMYLAAGLATGSAARFPWHDFVRQRIFVPLGMADAEFTRSAVLKTADHASPHHLQDDGKLKVIAWYDDDKQVRASGSIKASARDLGNWLRFQLMGGTFAGKRLVSARGLAETHTPQTVIRREGGMKAAHPEATQLSYGLGWMIEDYRGRLLSTHGGATQGFRARVVLVGRSKLGIALLMNADSGTSEASMHLAVTNGLVDLLLGLPRKDWNGYYAALCRNEKEALRARQAALEAGRRKGTRPARELTAYAGSYCDPGYGKAAVTLEKGTLVLRWSSFTSRLEHFHLDTFRVRGDPLVARDLVVFHLGADGEVATLDFLGVSFRKKK